MTYLLNDICTFTPLRKIDYNIKKYKIILSNELIKILFIDKLFGVYCAELYVSSKKSKKI